MGIKGIILEVQGNGTSAGEWAVVETVDGRRFIYAIKYSDKWDSKESFISKVRDEFERDSKESDFAQSKEDIFIEM